MNFEFGLFVGLARKLYIFFDTPLLESLFSPISVVYKHLLSLTPAGLDMAFPPFADYTAPHRYAYPLPVAIIGSRTIFFNQAL